MAKFENNFKLNTKQEPIYSWKFIPKKKDSYNSFLDKIYTLNMIKNCKIFRQ